MVYKTQGTCSREIHFDVENNKLKNVSFVGGCNGNLKGIGLLVEGMDPQGSGCRYRRLPYRYRSER